VSKEKFEMMQRKNLDWQSAQFAVQGKEFQVRMSMNMAVDML
jgi:hypothetical protein